MSIFSSSTEVADREAKNKIYGVVIGIVTQNNDKDGKTYRVKVRFPWLKPSKEQGSSNEEPIHDETWWARIATFSAGEIYKGETKLGPRGAFFMPDIGDEVLVAFEHGDISRPVIIGRLWSDVGPTSGGSGGKPNHPVYSHTDKSGKLGLAVDGEKGPHAKTKHEAGANDLSGIRTRTGHMLVFNDNESEQAIYLRSANQHRIELVDGGNQGILIADPNGNYIWLKSGKSADKGDIELFTAGKITMTADKDISILSKTGDISITTSKGKMTLDSGSTFDANSKAKMTLNSSASMEIKASNSLTLTGSQINLN